MKCFITLLLLLLFITSGFLPAQNNYQKSSSGIQNTKIVPDNSIQHSVDPKILEFYTGYSYYTDPGEYVSMYKDLPDSLADLCKLIKSQLIHPVADLPKYRDLIPPERSYEDLKYPTVKTILAGLKSYNPDGLIINRKPEQRLVVSCRYHAILLASILKYKGIPTRVRYGFASYLYPGYHIYHVICEVWDKNEKRWILVDPDRQKIDLKSQQFEFAGNVWPKYRQGKVDPAKYGVPNWWGSNTILDAFCHDLAAVLGNEHIYFDRPPISADTTMDAKNLNPDQLSLMDKVSEVMKNIDDNFYELKNLYSKNKLLQFKNYIKEE
ncbi:MAG: transglutaminase-like domain-containing protein [Ignavibacteriaceae bacterium]